MTTSISTLPAGVVRDLEEYMNALGLNPLTFADEVSQATGVRITREVIDHILRHRRQGDAPIAPKIAQAVCSYLSRELGRKILPVHIKHFSTI